MLFIIYNINITNILLTLKLYNNLQNRKTHLNKGDKNYGHDFNPFQCNKWGFDYYCACLNFNDFNLLESKIESLGRILSGYLRKYCINY